MLGENKVWDLSSNIVVRGQFFHAVNRVIYSLGIATGDGENEVKQRAAAVLDRAGDRCGFYCEYGNLNAVLDAIESELRSELLQIGEPVAA